MREGERKWGCRVVGEPEVTKAAPSYYVDEGGIVPVVLRAPRIKGEFRMLKTRCRNFRRRQETLPPAGSFLSSFNYFWTVLAGRLCETVYTGHASAVNNWCEVHP